jgi:hypothetical protein
VIEGLFRIGSDRGLEAVRAALDDGDPVVKAKAERFATKIQSPLAETHCPCLTKYAMCDLPGCEFNECDWEAAHKGRYKKCPCFRED